MSVAIMVFYWTFPSRIFIILKCIKPCRLVDCEAYRINRTNRTNQTTKDCHSTYQTTQLFQIHPLSLLMMLGLVIAEVSYTHRSTHYGARVNISELSSNFSIQLLIIPKQHNIEYTPKPFQVEYKESKDEPTLSSIHCRCCTVRVFRHRLCSFEPSDTTRQLCWKNRKTNEY